MTSALFSPFDLQGLTLANRIIVPPMCTYSAVEGVAQDWHLTHWANLLNSGAAMVIVEATAVAPEGRISNGCLGLWDSATQEGFGDKLHRARRLAPHTPVCLQLAHAGRKASSATPWEGGALLDKDGGGWETVAPSAIPHLPEEPNPTPLDAEGIERITNAFAAAAERAAALGVEAVEVHLAHGYLLHQFLSPLANQRSDQYGGTFERRIRFPLEVVNAVRKVFDGTVGVRVSATDWVEGGWNEEECADFSLRLKAAGCDFIHVSSGGVSPLQKVQAGPSFQVPFAKLIKERSGLPTIAVGLITDPAQAEQVVASGSADLVAIGRAILFNPRWGWQAAAALGGKVHAAPQYWRCAPADAADIFSDVHVGGR
jgi:2,4-dienoyl-CoA reductase-like NADH-dependent reductase (Old Yellow Enzyme family)